MPSAKNLLFQIEAAKALRHLTAREQERLDNGKKVYVGDYTFVGWKSKLPCYLFWCGACEHHAFDYPHGHIERQYLLCSYCGATHDFVPWWVVFKQLYEFCKLTLYHWFGPQ